MAATHACPICGRRHSAPAVAGAAKPKALTVKLPERADLDRAYLARELTKDQYFEACKRIGPRDDLRFFVRVTAERASADLLAEAEALLAELEQRAPSFRTDIARINRLRDRYRIGLGSLIVHAKQEGKVKP